MPDCTISVLSGIGRGRPLRSWTVNDDKGNIVAFLMIALGIWTCMHAYVLWRVGSVPFVATHVPRVALVGLAVLLGSSYIAARFVEATGLEFLGRPLEILGATWMGVVLLILTCLFIVDLVTLFGWILPRLAPSLRGWALVAAAGLSCVALVQGLRPPAVHEHEVELAGLPGERDGTVLVFISDLHLGTMTGEGWLAARIREIDALRPDLIVVGGDVFEGDSQREREILPTLRRLKARLGVFAVTGNHDGHERNGGGLDPLDEAGFRVLRNRWMEAAPGLVLAGVSDPGFRGQRPSGTDPVDVAMSGRPAGAATVFVSHVPAGAETAARRGAGLMLAGHTHGGQIWPFSLIVRAVTPLFAGQYVVDGMPVIVCRGTGTFGPRMRLWQRSEILRITLKAARRSVRESVSGGSAATASAP
jgi:predicted MPP superfamily phosphohydrolase